jgi:hypothetical protein
MLSLKKDSKNALLISIVYVGLSTILLYTISPKDPFAFDWMYDNLIYYLLMLLAIPGQLLSFGIRYGGSDSLTEELLLVGISQLVNILICWRIILYVKRK